MAKKKKKIKKLAKRQQELRAKQSAIAELYRFVEIYWNSLNEEIMRIGRELGELAGDEDIPF